MATPPPILVAVVALVPACAAPAEDFIQQTYIKASNVDIGDDFGRALALSADGATLAVGAFREDSPARGINQRDDNVVDDTTIGSLGAVYVFAHDGAGWRQEAYIKASNSEIDDFFGRSLALSADGNTLAVGAPGEDSASTTDQNSNAAELSGAVYVFSRSAGSWSQAAYVKSSRPAAVDNFGASLALSGDGAVLAVGAPEAMAGTGAVHIFTREAAAWTPKQQLAGPGAGSPAAFGSSVALSLDGSTLVVGSPGDDAGAVHVFARAAGAWARQVRLTASPGTPGTTDFGSTLAVSGDGSTLAVGAPRESSATAGSAAAPVGAVHLYARSGATWSAGDHLALSSTDAGNFFGLGIALSPDGARLAVGAPIEPRAASDEPLDSCSADLGGTVYLFAGTGASWGSRVRVQGSNTCKDDHFGQSVALSRDGSILAVGANGEDSAAPGIDKDPNDNSAHDAGAAYVLHD